MSPQNGTTQNVRVVFVDKNVKELERLCTGLQMEGHRVTALESAKALLSDISQSPCDVVCLSAHLPSDQLIEILSHLDRYFQGLPIIVLAKTCRDSKDSKDSRDCSVFSGFEVYDELVHPINIRKLQMAVRNAANHYQMRLRIAQLEREVSDHPFDELIGQSAAMRRLYSEMERVAHSDVSVLLVGESGTGKELIAKTIHSHSGRKQGPFIAVDCAALPEYVQDVELFGMESETLRNNTPEPIGRTGKLEQAHTGTLFIKGIESLSQTVQSRFLRAIETRGFYRVGGTAERQSDFRVMTATNKGLSEEVSRGAVREDLYFRLAVFEMLVPALRDRAGDQVLLAKHFVGLLGAGSGVGSGAVLAADAVARLQAYHWPGNVREMRNAIERALMVCKGGQIRAEDLPSQVQAAEAARDSNSSGRGRRNKMKLVHSSIAEESPKGDDHTPSADADASTLADVERVAIEAMMRRVNGNISLAARQLGIGRSTLYRKLRAYGYKGSLQG